MFAQDELCGTLPNLDPDPVGVYSGSSDPEYLDTFDPITFNIFYWGIYNTDGSYPLGTPLTPQKAQESVDVLNEAYADYNICFNLIGMDTIRSSDHHDDSYLSLINILANANNYQYKKQNAFNVYVPYRLALGSGSGKKNYTHLVANDASLTNQVLTHELGHSFTLDHTFGKDRYRPDSINCERVTRDTTDIYYNANVAGDELHQTNAVPNFFREQHNYFAYALEEADIGYDWDEALIISKLEYGFNDLRKAGKIDTALIAYGFTEAERIYLRFNPAKNYAYIDTTNCSYNPDSRINDLTNSFFKDCVGTPYQILEADCRNTFTTDQTIRIFEAIDDDKYGEFSAAVSLTDIDLYIQDTETDIGQEPNIHTSIYWNSEDIWVRNDDDGTVVQEHENPIYDPVDLNYVYVRINNKACNASNGNELLKLYWAKANTALDWPLHWEGDFTMTDTITSQEVLMGDVIDSLYIPVIAAGESTILEFEWPVPNPDDYMNINNDNPWHFCLLARMVSTIDTMSFTEGTFITDNVKNNNNIAWKNLSIIVLDPAVRSDVGAVVAVGNNYNTSKNFTLEFFKEFNEAGKSIYEEAEVSIVFDDIIYNAWNSGGKMSQNFKGTKNDKRIIVEDNYALIENIQLAANEIGTISVNFNFLTEELTSKTKYIYHLTQINESDNKVMGGETFEINKEERVVFEAFAGDDEEIDENESITISARDINETATYNWYDPDGNLIYTGTDLTVSSDITKIYKLEVISDMDGYKDYDEVQVIIKPYRIESLVPNPVSSLLTINYVIGSVESAYITVLNQNTAVSNNYILDINTDEVTIDVSSYPIGLYSVILVCDGEMQNSKNLLKQ